jgi:16S rRNA (uracil1498-N3)-methyltransferase
VDPVLRRSAAHVLVADVGAPAADDAVAHHLVRVLRLRDGAEVTVTDGAGRWRPCRLGAGGVLEATGPAVAVPAPDPVLTLAVAPPKGDRLDWLVAKATEVGVDRIVLVDAIRSVVKLRADRTPRQLERLRRIALEAAMQSRRVWLPEISGPVPAAELLAAPHIVVAEPGGRRVGPGDTTVLVGPEGGWAPEELAGVADDRRVSLAGNVLRVETAAVAAALALVWQREGERR